ncbi:anhydro-N-acetylmuramic acid kinase [Pelistega sp. NLN82]|uniref:Anhydro-N-acetylmuramic acid kinase n=1 Tax=Pelistega ratti TaxID=2652177 RepID=A0A6L9Y4F9_9BURK|nr:anhydro-N-acetylmuramic acid kinase [Pelistega ratti]NEN75352.1 anhydro-N-acetylmuramic acid kinase [Pelistega ratti]
MKSSTSMYFIGLMSGTSTDGVDGVLVDFQEQTLPKIIGFTSLAMPTPLREIFLSLNQKGENELEKAFIAANQLADIYAQCCHTLLKETGLSASDIVAIGAHGQTVRHRPDLGFTVQLNAPAYLAEQTGINVVADFRSRDIAAGGQGAPFAPLLHQALFSDPQRNRVILNLGGIANITLLAPHQPLLGFDTGPANALMDYWIQQHQQKAYDHHGEWGASGQVHHRLLAQLLQEPYFQQAAPKSTGRDLFNAQWLSAILDNFPPLAPQDIMATLRALTSHSVVNAIQRYMPTVDEIIVCGGGAKNQVLLQEISTLANCPVHIMNEYGIDSQAVEALAFAWLAKAFIDKTPLNFPTITGAHHATIAGAFYPK